MNLKLIFAMLLSWGTLMAAAQDDTINDWINHSATGTVSSDGACGQRVLSATRKSDGLWIKTTGGMLRLQPLQCGAVHVSYGAENAVKNYQDYVKDGTKPLAKYRVTEEQGKIIVSRTVPGIMIDKETGALTFTDNNGKPILKETSGHARFNAELDSVKPFCRFTLSPDEALYGLGQFRDGYMNLRGKTRELIQFNTQAAVPVINSTGGWGLIWTNPSRTLFRDSPNGMEFSSDYGNTVDYYVYGGSSLDRLVASYRQLSGTMPMLPVWALGYHQSRNRYHSDREVLDVARRMKDEKIPMGSIFVDYHHWGKYGTGSFRFDEAFFPNVDVLLDSLHRNYDTHMVLTVWPSFKPGTENYTKLNDLGYILGDAKAIDGYIYDVFNPAARKMYRDLFRPMLQYDIDGWFLDGPEPDHVASFLPQKTFLGEAQRVRNIYPLLHSSNFKQLLDEVRPGKRHYMLTRCAWAGQQRYGTAVWSGDIPATMDELRLQITAGLNFTATGIPYWTTDIGGYLGGDPSDKAYREVFTRWFQYGTFCPVFRNHGRRYPGDTTVPNELWAYGDTVKNICADFIRLRYRLMPYIRSVATDVTLSHYTPMRLLAFDFPEDVNVRDCKDQFMFGPSLMVCPVTKMGATKRQVYLPAGADWYDFFTGEFYEGGSVIDADAPFERIPIFVKAGSIIPVDVDGKTEMDVYPGYDADFTLYDEDGVTTGYMTGKVDKVELHWDDASERLDHNIGYKVNIKGKLSPKRRYGLLQKRLALGWNTWDVRSVLTHVYLPNALALDITLEDTTGNRATNFRIGDRGADAPRLRPYAHTPDGTYTKIGVNWHGADFIVESSAEGLRNYICITPVNNPEGVKVVVEPKGLWKRGASVRVDSAAFVLATPHNQVAISGKVLGRHVATQRHRIVMDGTEPIVVCCNGLDNMNVTSVKQMLSDAEARLSAEGRRIYGEHYDSYNAMSTALCWNNIYDPSIRRVITPVSRIWSSEWFGSSDFGGFTLFCWDAYFASMMLSAVDKDLAYANAMEMTLALTESGFVPNCYYSNGFKSRDRSQPPVGSLALWTLYRNHGDKWLLALAYDNLLAWNNWWVNSRTDDGLICPGSSPYEKVSYFRSEYEQNNRYASNLETGLDNSPMYDGVRFDDEKHLLAQQDVGLTSLFIMDCDYLSKIAAELGRKEDAKMLDERATLYRMSLQSFWDGGTGFYYNRSAIDGKLNRRIAPTSFYPMLANAPTPQQADSMVRKHLLNPDEFWGEFVIPSISRNDPSFNDNEYWRGRIWAPLNLLVYLGLRNYDFPDVTREFSEKSERLLMQSWQQNGYIFENYNATTGQGDDTLRSDKFYHWGALLGYIALIESGMIVL